MGERMLNGEPFPSKFQSESNLGLLWGAVLFLVACWFIGFNPNQISAYYGGKVMKKKTLDPKTGFNPNQISAYYGGLRLRSCWSWCTLPVSIRIKSRLIMGGIDFDGLSETDQEFQSESNLGLLWGPGL